MKHAHRYDYRKKTSFISFVASSFLFENFIVNLKAEFSCDMKQYRLKYSVHILLEPIDNFVFE